jgi:DNA-binding CsgD family transcriptional regulator
MQTDLHQKIKQTIGNSKSDKNLEDSVKHFCADLGVGHFFFVSSLFKISNTSSDLSILNGNPEEWQDHYDSSNYFESDIVVNHCRSKHTPLVWLDPKMPLDRINKTLYAEAAEYGIVSGISFPYHGIGSDFGMFSGSISTKFKDSPLDSIETQHALYLLGASLFDLYTQDRGNSYANLLTQREKECLRWAARGKTSWEMSVILKISERTVGFHLDNAKTKLNTTTRTAAVSKALIHSLL